MGYDSVKKEVNPNSLPEVFTGNPTRPVRVTYLLLDQYGNGDEVHYNDERLCFDALLDERGIGERIQSMMIQGDVRRVQDAFADQAGRDEYMEWLWRNREAIRALMEEFGYRILTVIK